MEQCDKNTVRRADGRSKLGLVRIVIGFCHAGRAHFRFTTYYLCNINPNNVKASGSALAKLDERDFSIHRSSYKSNFLPRAGTSTTQSRELNLASLGVQGWFLGELFLFLIHSCFLFISKAALLVYTLINSNYLSYSSP